jgi:hypothetical protein
LEKKIKSADKQFTQLKAQLVEGDDEDESDEEKSHFQLIQHFFLANHCVPLDS